MNKDNIIANVVDVLKFLGYKNEELNTDEFEVLFKNVIDIYNIKYNQCDHNIIKTIKNTFQAKYKFIHMVPCEENDNVVLTDDESLIAPTDMNDVIDTYGGEKKIIPKLNNNYLTVEQRDEEYDELIKHLEPTITNAEEKAQTAHYNYLKNLRQPVQKSREWFDMRNNMITASMVADILGEGHFGTREEALLDKLGVLPDKFKENMFVYHGKKYEKIATMIYEHLFNTKVGEFGLIPFQPEPKFMNINYIGASPDGLGTCITLDGKFNPLIGRMLEIKCPLKRQIKTSGLVKGTICPIWYWYQVQVQLASCKNEECDFWQANISEYDEEYWYGDTSEEPDECIFTVEQNQRKFISHKLTKGAIIQLMPKDTSKIPKGDMTHWYSKYIYPSNLLMTDLEYESWIDYIEDNWQELYPQYKEDYYFDKPLFWKLRNCHNVLIKRDRQWFESNLPKFELFWNQVLEGRSDDIKKKKYLDDYMKKKKKGKHVDVMSTPETSESSSIEKKKKRTTKIVAKKETLDDFIDSEPFIKLASNSNIVPVQAQPSTIVKGKCKGKAKKEILVELLSTTSGSKKNKELN